MNEGNTQEKALDRPYLTALILTLFFLLLHLLCNFVPWRAELWGVFHLSFFKPAQQLLFIAAALLFIGAGYILDQKGVQFPAGRKGFLPLVIFSVLAALSFYFLRVGPFLMGDAVALIGKLEQDFIKYTEAGDILLHRFLYKLLPPYKVAAIDTYVWTSIASGIAFLAILLGWTKKAGKSPGCPSLIFLSFISLASILLFYGYAESYTLLYLGAFVFLTLSLNALDTGKWLLPCLFLLLSIFLHISAVCFIPGFVFMLLLMRRKTIPANTGRLLKISIAAGLVFAILISLYPSKSQNPIFLRLLAHDGTTYTLFSFAHIKDTVNELLLVVPFGLILLIISLKKNIISSQVMLMAVFSIFSFIGMFIVDPVFEAADWDLMSFQGLPVMFLGLYYARQTGIFTRPWRYIGIVLAMIAFHTLPWVLSNHSLAIAVNQYAEASLAYRHKNPARPFIKGSWSLITIPKNNEYSEKTICLCQYAADRNITSPSLYQNWGLAYARLEQYSEASLYYEKATQSYPEGAQQQIGAYISLAVSLLQTGNVQHANEAAIKGLFLKIEYKETVRPAEVWLWDMIMGYQIEKNTEQAVMYSKSLLDLAPQYPNSYINHGLALAANGRLKEAVSVWQEGLLKFPGNRRLHELIYESTAPFKSRN